MEKVFKLLNDICQKHKFDYYIVGGWVRDSLLGRPSNDIDLLISGDSIDSGIQVATELYECLGEGILQTYQQFGTAKLRYHNLELEFVAPRKEEYQVESRKPKVVLATLEEDVSRRDFTINALLLGKDQKILDLTTGYQDLQDRVIKTIGDPFDSFQSDPLRMLRGIRFSCQLGFRIDQDCLEAMKKSSQRVSILSKSRILEELEKILSCPEPSKGFKLLSLTGILGYIFPELEALRGVEVREGRGHKDNFFHTLEVLDNVASETTKISLRWAALFHDLGKSRTKHWDPEKGWTFHNHPAVGSGMIPEVLRKLGISLGDKEYYQKLTELHMRPICISKEEITDSAVRRLLFEAGDYLEDLLLLSHSDITSKRPGKKEQLLQNFEIVREKLKVLEEKDRIRNFKVPVNGFDIMTYFGVEPCQEISIIKDQIKEAILEGKIPNTREASWELMIQIGSNLFGDKKEGI